MIFCPNHKESNLDVSQYDTMFLGYPSWWHGNLFKGRYKLPRIMQTIVDLGVLNFYALTWIQRSCHIPSCICRTSDKRTDGDGEKYAHGGFLLRICAHEHSSGNALGNDPVNVPSAFEGQETAGYGSICFI